jgi:hypothetical protein
MPKKSRSVKKNKHNKTKRVSKRVLAMWDDPESVWGKNKPLENWWGDLASGKKVVVIYMDGEHKSVKLNKRGTDKFKAQFDGFDADPTIIAVLSSNMSQDAYEENLYPKAKDKKVEEVIKNYKHYFASFGPTPKDMIENGYPKMEKIMFPY